MVALEADEQNSPVASHRSHFSRIVPIGKVDDLVAYVLLRRIRLHRWISPASELDACPVAEVLGTASIVVVPKGQIISTVCECIIRAKCIVPVCIRGGHTTAVGTRRCVIALADERSPVLLVSLRVRRPGARHDDPDESIP